MICKQVWCAGVLAILVTGALAIPGDVSAAEDVQAHVLSLSLEELMEVTVTSVSRKKERQFEAAAAVHVITQEDIRRSGATTIPDALRLAPGVQVAKFNANTWAITARGSNSIYANKLLVLIDGRSVYSPTFSGTNWDAQDTLLEDIDRIEVIRGPGGTLWGANAVNGVINIITKNARETQGGMAIAGGGDEEQGFGALRYGGKVDDTTHFRVYGKYFNRDDSEGLNGGNGNDDWDMARGGFRIDMDYSENNSLTVTGDYYDGEVDAQLNNQVVSLSAPFVASPMGTSSLDGGHLLARWGRVLDDGSLNLQFYYNRERRRSVLVSKLQEDTLDFELQHRFHAGERHELVWGLGERIIFDDYEDNFGVSFSPSNETNHRFSAFLQDEITLIPSRLKFTAGSKFEVNSLTGFEVQPSARVLWTPDEKNSVWAAVSRAVRTPSRAEDDARINASVLAGPTLVSLFGNDELDSEELVALEVGYRMQPVHNFSFDIATFYNFYENLRTLEFGAPFLELSPLPPHGVQPISAQNLGSAETYGVEIAGQWNPFDWWRVGGAFTWLEMNLDADAASNDPAFLDSGGNDPEIMWNLQSRINLPHQLEFDTTLYYVDSLDNLNVPSYTRLDLRLGWRPSDDLELSLIVQDLLDPAHPEFAPETLGTGIANQTERSVFGKAIWKF